MSQGTGQWKIGSCELEVWSEGQASDRSDQVAGIRCWVWMKIALDWAGIVIEFLAQKHHDY